MERRSLTDMHSGRYVWLDILKGLGILFVVVGHFCSNTYVYNWIYSFHMPLFFFVSGYLYREASILSSVKHKFMTLMIPYFLFGIISQSFFAINECMFSRTVRISELVWGLLYGTYSSIAYNRVLWFLPALFCITNIYNFLNNVCGKKKELLYIFVIVLTALYVAGIVPAICPWGIDNRVSNFMIYYMVGNIVAEKGWIESIRELPMKHSAICAFLMVSINFILSKYRLSGGGDFGIFAFIAWCYGVGLCIFIHNAIWKALRPDRTSIFMYFMHSCSRRRSFD